MDGSWKIPSRNGWWLAETINFRGIFPSKNHHLDCFAALSTKALSICTSLSHREVPRSRFFPTRFPFRTGYSQSVIHFCGFSVTSTCDKPWYPHGTPMAPWRNHRMLIHDDTASWLGLQVSQGESPRLHRRLRRRANSFSYHLNDLLCFFCDLLCFFFF